MNFQLYIILHGMNKSSNSIVSTTIFRSKKYSLRPTLPAFLSPNVANVLVENFGIGTISNVEDDIEMFMNA